MMLAEIASDRRFRRWRCFVADHPNFWEDVIPLFRDVDFACMGARGIPLASIDWWKADGHFAMAYDRLSSGSMPLGGPRWKPEQVQVLAGWKENGFVEGPKSTEE